MGTDEHGQGNLSPSPCPARPGEGPEERDPCPEQGWVEGAAGVGSASATPGWTFSRLRGNLLAPEHLVPSQDSQKVSSGPRLGPVSGGVSGPCRGAVRAPALCPSHSGSGARHTYPSCHGHRGHPIVSPGPPLVTSCLRTGAAPWSLSTDPMGHDHCEGSRWLQGL